MYSLRAFLSYCLFLISLNALANNPGIALIHGTNDHREDAVGGYWQPDFIDSLRKALPDPDNYLVLACDFSHIMWDEDAAGCTADQLLAFIDGKKINQLTLYTHSNGANIIRWIVSNPTYDARYLRLTQVIKQVIAIAPSSAGTPLADEALDGNFFEEALGWFMGYQSDSVKQQRVADMALYNDEILFGTAGRPTLPVPFRVIVGSDVAASPFSSASYCNGYLSNAALKVTKTYLDDCADGFINCTSQAAAGTVWFTDFEKSKEHLSLNHNQSRHSCFGLDNILRQALGLTA